jgi:DNA modification methylase
LTRQEANELAFNKCENKGHFREFNLLPDSALHDQILGLFKGSELLRMYTSPGDIVVEMCCGTAPFAMAGLLEGRHVLSLDVDATVVDLASARLEEARKTLMAKLTGVKATLKKRKRRTNLTYTLPTLPVEDQFPPGIQR